MARSCILISGPAVSEDERLCADLGKDAEVLRVADNRKLMPVLKLWKPDLLIVELGPGGPEEMEQIRMVKRLMPGLPVILIDGDGDCELIATGFSCGASDAFRKPYKRHLLVERVNALLRQAADSHGRRQPFQKGGRTMKRMLVLIALSALIAFAMVAAADTINGSSTTEWISLQACPEWWPHGATVAAGRF